MEKTRYYSVSQLNNYIKGVFDDELILQNIAVVGEVFECSETGGNLFVTLRDENAIISCVKFGKDFVPKVGDKIVAVGSVRFYAKGGRVSFQIKTISPYGEGEFKRKLEELKIKLKEEGLFDNKLPLPKFVKSVAVVTSSSGAVIHDFISVIKKNHSYIDVTLFDARVQGEGADESIIKAINRVQALGCFDVIIVARGGGSSDDLNCFNSELLARAVYNSNVPIISSVGHEINYTLCDFCATMRAGTPSIAGEIVCRVNEEFIAKYYEYLQIMTTAIARRYESLKNKTLVCANKLVDGVEKEYYQNKIRLNALFLKAKDAMLNKGNGISRNVFINLSRLNSAIDKVFVSKENSFRETVSKLNASNPLSIIEKGYSKVFKGNKVVTSLSEIEVGTEVDIVLRDGIASANISKIELSEGEK